MRQIGLTQHIQCNSCSSLIFGPCIACLFGEVWTVFHVDDTQVFISGPPPKENSINSLGCVLGPGLPCNPEWLGRGLDLVNWSLCLWNGLLKKGHRWLYGLGICLYHYQRSFHAIVGNFVETVLRQTVSLPRRMRGITSFTNCLLVAVSSSQATINFSLAKNTSILTKSPRIQIMSVPCRWDST